MLTIVPLAIFAAGCANLGFELENYGFYGSVPVPEGQVLQPGTVLERVRVPGATDTVDLREAEFQVDSARMSGLAVWVLSRTVTGGEGESQVDSVWMEQATLKTIAAVSRIGDITYRQRFDRRSVETEKIGADGRSSRRRTLHAAAPYSLVGIEVVLGAIQQLNIGRNGSLPVVAIDGTEMKWLRYEVISSTLEPRAVTGGTIFKRMWVMRTDLDGRSSRYWIDSDERLVIRREEFDRDGTKLLVMRGQGVPKVRMFPVEPLAAPPAAQGGRTSIRGISG